MRLEEDYHAALAWMVTKHLHIFTSSPQRQLGVWGESCCMPKNHSCPRPGMYHAQIHQCTGSNPPPSSPTMVVEWQFTSCLHMVDLPVLVFLLRFHFSYAYHNRTYPTFSLRTLDVTMTSLWHHLPMTSLWHHLPMTSFLHHYDLIPHLWPHLLHYDVITGTL